MSIDTKEEEKTQNTESLEITFFLNIEDSHTEMFTFISDLSIAALFKLPNQYVK